MSGQPSKSRHLAIDVWVSDHARDRARERFPGFKAARIVDEVRAALKEGRFSTHKPPSFGGREWEDCLYVWSPGEVRCYPLILADNGYVVATTLSRLHPELWQAR